MDTIKTCNLDNDKKHVCFKDLKDYWRKDEYFENLNELERAQIKANLGFAPETQQVDVDLSKVSKNPVQNRVITQALENKADIKALAKVGITGQYKDIKNAPCELPNPEGILFNLGPDSQVYYDGTEGVVLNLKTKLSQFENDEEFATKEDIEDAISIKQIKVNGEIKAIGCDKSLNIHIPTNISELLNDSGYMREEVYRNKIEDLERRIIALENALRETSTP